MIFSEGLHLKGLTLGAFFALLSAGLVPVSAEPRPENCVDIYKHGRILNQSLEMRLEEKVHQLRIPKDYSNWSTSRREGDVFPNKLILMNYETFEPFARFSWQQKGDPVQLTNISVMIDDEIPLDQLLLINLSYRFWLRDDAFSFLEIVPSDFGLSEVLVDERVRSRAILYDGIFIDGNRFDDIDTVIMCDGSESRNRSGRCKHYFRSHGIDVGLGYDRRNFEIWKKIQENIDYFVGCIAVPGIEQ